MANDLEVLKERILNLSDDELIKMVHVESADYLQEAVDFATEELKRRNLEEVSRETIYELSEDPDFSADMKETFVVSPTAILKFPPSCVGCFQEQPSLSIFAGVSIPLESNKAGVGFLLGGVLGGFVGSLMDAANVYTWKSHIPICPVCKSKMSDAEIRPGTLDGASSQGNRYFIIESKDNYISLSLVSEEYALELEKINPGLVHRSLSEAESSEEVILEKKNQDTRQSVQFLDISLLDSILPHAPEMKWYRSPLISEKQADNAIKRFAKVDEGEEILGLADGTFWRSGKKGCVLTNKKIYYSGTGELWNAEWGEIASVNSKKFPFYTMIIELKDGSDHIISMSEINADVVEKIGRIIHHMIFFQGYADEA